MPYFKNEILKFQIERIFAYLTGELKKKKKKRKQCFIRDPAGSKGPCTGPLHRKDLTKRINEFKHQQDIKERLRKYLRYNLPPKCTKKIFFHFRSILGEMLMNVIWL